MVRKWIRLILFQNFKENVHGVPSLSGNVIVRGCQSRGFERRWSTPQRFFLGIGGVFMLWAEKFTVLTCSFRVRLMVNLQAVLHRHRTL